MTLIDGNSIESVQCAKQLGVMINTWKDHIEEVVTEKASRKHFFLVQLKRAHVPSDDFVAYYPASRGPSIFPDKSSRLI